MVAAAMRYCSDIAVPGPAVARKRDDRRWPKTAVPESIINSGELRPGWRLWAQTIGKDVRGDDFRGRSVWPSRPFCYYLP